MNHRSPDGPPTAKKSGPTLLVAIEEGDMTEQVLAMALAQAQLWPDSHLHLAHVIAIPALAAATFARDTHTDAEARELRHSERRVLDDSAQLAREVLGPRVFTHLLAGPVASELSLLAREIDADLLIAGTHDPGPVKQLLFGSLAAPLVQHAPCSVLLVRAKPSSSRSEPAPLCVDCLRAQGASCGVIHHCERHAASSGHGDSEETSH